MKKEIKESYLYTFTHVMKEEIKESYLYTFGVVHTSSYFISRVK